MAQDPVTYEPATRESLLQDPGPPLRSSRLRWELSFAMSRAPEAADAADLLCAACVGLLGVDGAAISLIHDETTRGTVGASGELSRTLDELQFTLGEGPCLDAVRSDRIVLAPDLAAGHERWPLFTRAALDHDAAAVFALPVSLSGVSVGALDLFRHSPGELGPDDLAGARWAARLAAAPLRDLLARAQTSWPDEQLAERPTSPELHQASGMLMGAWGVDGVEALTRLRAHAFTAGTTAHRLAAGIVERSVLVDAHGWVDGPTGS